MPKKWPNLESLLKNEGKAISWRGSNGKIFHLALGNTSNRPQKGAIYNCCLAVYGPLSVCQSSLFSPSASSLPRVLSVICLYNALSVVRGPVSIWIHRKDADLTPRLLRNSSVGFGVSYSGVSQVENYAPDIVVSFFPHICLASPRVQRLLNCLHYYKSRQTQAEARVHWIICNIQYLVWSFPSNKISSKWRQKCCQIKKVRFHLHFALV